MFFKSKEKSPGMNGPVEYLLVGLGNPGNQYEGTRHNAGFLAVDALAKKLGVKVDRLKFKSLCANTAIGGHKVLLMKPSTFMNNSGEAVREAAQFYKIAPEHILVLVDDVSLDVGRMRIRRKGSDGGHNGLKSIIYHLASDGFLRVKLGVGKKPHPDYDLADWVLGKLRREDAAVLDEMFRNAAEAACMIVDGEIDSAMNRYNS